MTLHDLVSQVIINTKGSADGSFFSITADSSLALFAPELLLCLTVLVMLFVRLFEGGRKVNAFYIALAGSLLALYAAAPWELLSGNADALVNKGRIEIFTGMLVFDSFSVFMRSMLLLFAALFVIFTKLTGIPDHEDGPDIYSLVLGSTLGMCLMTSANHLMMVFMAVEMASVPSYVLAGIMKGKRKASEAALKYAVYGAGAAGVMLYGISLLAGLLNTAHLPTIALRLAEKMPTFSGSEMMVLSFAGMMLGVGLAFKLSAFPFHFWAPDVFEGATAEVGAFLSIASKAAALALLVRVVLGIGAIPMKAIEPGAAAAPQAVVVEADTYHVAHMADAEATAEKPAVSDADRSKALQSVRMFIAKLVAFFAIITCTFGNLAAYGQTNIKRMFAYSTIAHAGYMLMAIAGLMAIVGTDTKAAQNAVSALGIYLVIYLFMNLAAFACVAFLRNALRTEEIADYAGLIRKLPLTVICFCLVLFALIGLPPLSGFIGKFAIFASLAECYLLLQKSDAGAGFLLVTLVAGGLNSAISLFYYLRVAKIMTIDEEPEDRRPFVFSDVSLSGAFLWLLVLPTVGLIVFWDGLSTLALAAAKNLFV
ncbi:MAG: NADH-quinone oxidoreductase subunit N [Planctomycetaceae bacterium]